MNGQRSSDFVLQVMLVLALMIVFGLFYWSRVIGIRASDSVNNTVEGYANMTAFQLEQAVQKTQSKIALLQSEYANDLLTLQKETAKIEQSSDFSDLEKKEKLLYINELYSDEYFQGKQELIDQEFTKLETLKRVECAKFCDFNKL